MKKVSLASISVGIGSSLITFLIASIWFSIFNEASSFGLFSTLAFLNFLAFFLCFSINRKNIIDKNN